ncbi:MAG: hypothetical protein WD512_20460 [Candidatus Paceibacterota bacterium]
MQNRIADANDLYIVSYVDEYGRITGFPMGGGSSTKPSIKAHDNYLSAKRSSRFFPESVVVKASDFKVVSEK